MQTTDNQEPQQIRDQVPGERDRLVVSGRNTEDNRPCTMIVIHHEPLPGVVHEQAGTWVIHGLGNQGIRLPTPDMAELAEAILERAR